jgi:Putative restriction endonuclease
MYRENRGGWNLECLLVRDKERQLGLESMVKFAVGASLILQNDCTFVYQLYQFMTDITQKILASPDAIRQIEYLHNAMLAEKQRRKEFHKWITPVTKAEFINGQMLFPAPDLAVEILSKKTAARDKGIKKEDYAAHGVTEYWIIDPEKQTIEQNLLFSAKDKVYLPAKTILVHGVIESKAIPGFEIPVKAIFDEAANVEALKSLI